MANSLIFKHYRYAIAKWPVDVLRPEVSFAGAMQRRMERRFGSPTTSPTSVLTPSPLVYSEAAELAQTNALYSFLENRYTKKYPLSDTILKPASNPAYYQNLAKELEEAPRRSWFGRLANRWKGFLRFS